MVGDFFKKTDGGGFGPPYDVEKAKRHAQESCLLVKRGDDVSCLEDCCGGGGVTIEMGSQIG